MLPLLRSRHWRVLDLLAGEPLLATGQVEALVFAEGTPLSRARTCRKTLRELTGWKLVHRDRPPPGRAGGGSEPAVFALTTAGDRALALRDGRSPGRPRRPADRGAGFRRHLLDVAGLRITATDYARQAGLRLSWTAEPDCWMPFRSRLGSELLKPDAYVEFAEPGGGTVIAWVEVDRGTQSVPVTIQAKVRRYCRAALAVAADRKAVPSAVFIIAQALRRERIASLAPGWAEGEGVPRDVAARLFSFGAPGEFVQLLLKPGEPSETARRNPGSAMG